MKNDKKYAMKRRRYGWGWTPVTVKTWMFILAQIGIVFASILLLPMKPVQPTTLQIIGLLIIILLVVVSIVLVSSFIAPKPHWRWGKKETDNPDEDF